MSESSGERRVVSALIADIAGSTTIGEQLGPERSKFLFDDVVRLMRQEVERFGGTVAQLTGDGVLALFGAPTAHDDDAERAVRAALALRESVAHYGDEVGPSYKIHLAARVAVNTGPVVIPQREAPPDALYNALGDTVNVAARLQTFADVVVGPLTARQVEESFELEELGELELKGKSAPVTAYRVVSLRERPQLRPEGPLIGRTDEIGKLHAALEGLMSGEGAVVSITGEPGIGKSRLVAEAARRFDGRIRFLTGHAVSYAETIPYWPVRDLLRSWLGLGISDPEARVRLELRAGLTRALAGDAEEAYPFVATVLGVTIEPQALARLGDFAQEALQYQTFDWLYRLLIALAGERPLCIVVDDVHWSDEATLGLLDRLLPAAEQAAVAFVLIHRSDPGHPAWHVIDHARRRFRRSFIELELEALPDPDAHALAAVDAGGELAEDLAHLLADRAGGNPYFIGEVVRDLRERGALAHEHGRVVLIGDPLIPAGLQEALQARLDRLDVDAREVITTAAVIGRSFGSPLLDSLVPKTRLRATLSELQWLRLVVEERPEPAPEYRFQHGLVQEVAYASLTEGRRRDLHRRVGEALESIHADAPAEVYGLLAHHFSQANDPERAIGYLLKAGDAARAAYANDEAIDSYQRALGFMDRSDPRARNILLKIALTLHLAFDFHAANEAFGEAFARPMPMPVRHEPTERIVWAVPAAWGREVTPGHSYTVPAFEVTRNLYRGLVAIGPDFDTEPELAERFSVSDDGRTYSFTIRSDAHWSDGTPVTAHDFAFTFGQMAEDHVATAHWLDGVSARALDERRLEIELREPRNDFLYALSQPPFFPWPRHVFERDGRDWHVSLPLVGNGPFILTNRDENHMLITAAAGWHGARGNVVDVTLELEGSLEVAADRWRRGDYDVLQTVLTLRAVPDEKTVVHRAPGLFTWYLGFDARHAPFDDARVRRALAHAIDRTGPAQLLRGTAAATGGLVPPTVPGHSHRAALPYDPPRARALLGDAGYGDGRFLEISLACLDLWEDATSEVAAQLERIGVRVRLLSLSSDPDLEAAIEGDAHAFVWAWGGEYPSTGRGFLEPIIREPPMYRDAQVEELLARAASLRDQDERLRTYREFERIWIGEQAAVVPIAYGDILLWVRPWVTGMWVNATETSTFAHAVVSRHVGDW